MYEEIFAQYDFDALFIDGSPWPRWFGEPVCGCPWCESIYLKETGESLRTATDDPRVYGRRVQWSQDCSEQFLDEIYAIVHCETPGPAHLAESGRPAGHVHQGAAQNLLPLHRTVFFTYGAFRGSNPVAGLEDARARK